MRTFVAMMIGAGLLTLTAVAVVAAQDPGADAFPPAPPTLLAPAEPPPPHEGRDYDFSEPGEISRYVGDILERTTGSRDQDGVVIRIEDQHVIRDIHRDVRDSLRHIDRDQIREEIRRAIRDSRESFEQVRPEFKSAHREMDRARIVIKERVRGEIDAHFRDLDFDDIIENALEGLEDIGDDIGDAIDDALESFHDAID